MMRAPLLEARNVSKRFGGTQALAGVDLSLSAGEVHCLVGENGAGKSTLGKIIAGVVPLDDGDLRVDGRPVAYNSPRDALRDGITIVEQELALAPAMTVAENVLLGLRGPEASRAYVRGLIEQFSLGLDIDARVERLPVAEQQKVEILRALARRAQLVVMDEPTARLAAPEARNLLGIVRRLATSGTTVIYVSHFLEEVLEVADRITVLRNGRLVRTVPAAGETPASLVAAMLGREATLSFPPQRDVAPDAPVALSVRRLAGVSTVSDVSFDVRSGEILGLAGLVGSGRTEVARLIFGADRRAEGEVVVDGKPLTGGSPSAAIRCGVSYLPESRKDLGLFMGLSSQENVTLSHLARVCRAGMLVGRRERGVAASVLEQLAVTPANPRARVGTLSGGNQQKVLFAKWLWQRPRVLIADEPTRGVDVGAKFAIYQLLANLAAEGMAIVLISSEIEEIIGLSHRVVVMVRGRHVATLEGEDISEDRILHAAFASGAGGGAAGELVAS
jgi:ribose transport system ATP-binding protein